MPTSTINEESLLLLHVEDLCKGPAITCAPELSVVAMAEIMRDRDISGIVVVQDDKPVGIVSVRDFRNLIAERPRAIAELKVGDIMSTGLITTRRRDYAFEAIFLMAKHNIHRLVIVNDDGSLFGIVTDTDLLQLQTCTPLYISQEIESARSVEQLSRISTRMLDIVNCATRAGADTRSLVELISHFNDSFTTRIIAIMENEEGVRLPEGAAYLALGSEGRGEQTLRTDQDSAIVYSDDLPPEDLRAIERFSDRLVEALEAVGVPRCPGNTMASNPEWRHSVSEWKRMLDQWITIPKPDNMVNFGMFQDLRTLHGSQQLEKDLCDHIEISIRRNALFLAHMARHIVRFKIPMGIFGRIQTERRGENRGKVDIKRAGIFAVTEGASLLGLEVGVFSGTTWDKLEALQEKGVLSAGDAAVISDAFTFLVQLRLQRQLRALKAGLKPSNHIDPLAMTDREKDLFREALKGVATLQKIIRDRYKVDFISR